MGKYFDRALIVLWFIFALINLVTFIVFLATGEDTFRPAVWFAISVLFFRATSNDLKERK